MLKKLKERTHEGCGNRNSTLFCIMAALLGGLLVWKIHSSRHPSYDD